MKARKQSVGLFDALMIETTGSPSQISSKSKSPKGDSKAPPLKGKRRHAPKVRTGCLSCKRRRVKCDEGKPHCKRCLTSGTQCDGYLKPQPPKAPRLLMQRSLSAVSIPVGPSSKVQCQNEAEYQYFQVYKTEIAPKLGGTFATKVWDEIMIAASYQDQFVLNGLLAISAMTASRKATREGNDLLLAATHSDCAFKQYNASLQRMATEADAEISPRKAILACLIVCCFEALSSNVLAALSQAQTGHDLLQEWLAKNPYPNHTRVGISSPAPHIIEHELVQAAFMFDMQLLQNFDSRPVDIHAMLKQEGEETIDRMPHNFTDVEEARSYWHLAQRRAAHYVWEATASMSQTQLASHSNVSSTPAAPQNPYATPSPYTAPSSIHSGEEDSGLMQLANISMASNSHFLDTNSHHHSPPQAPQAFDPVFRYPTPTPNVPDYNLEHRKYSTENLRWRLAFSSLYSRLKKSNNSSLITAANILFVQSLASEINLTLALPHPSQSHNGTSHPRSLSNASMISNDSPGRFDKHINDFREVVGISREVIEMKKKEGHPEFVFEFGVTQALYLAVKFCPEERTRREAVEILRWFECREGAWDCSLLIDMEGV